MTLLRRSTLAAVLAALPALALAQYATPMRDVDNPDRAPYMANASSTINVNVVNTFIQIATPAGKRYFIDHVALQCNTPSAADTFPQVVLSMLVRNGNGATSSVFVPGLQMSYRGREGFSNRYIWSAQLPLSGVFADPDPFDPTGGRGISFNIYHTDVAVSVSCSAFVGAHTLPAP